MLFSFIETILKETRPAHLGKISDDRYLHIKLSERYEKNLDFASEDFYTLNQKGQTPMHRLVELSCSQSLDFLIQRHGIMVGAHDKYNRNLFEYALDIENFQFCNGYFDAFNRTIDFRRSDSLGRKNLVQIVIDKLNLNIKMIRNPNVLGLLDKVISVFLQLKKRAFLSGLFSLHDNLTDIKASRLSGATEKQTKRRQALVEDASKFHALLVPLYEMQGIKNCCQHSEKFQAAKKKLRKMR